MAGEVLGVGEEIDGRKKGREQKKTNEKWAPYVCTWELGELFTATKWPKLTELL
jgi:hypothetical protein